MSKKYAHLLSPKIKNEEDQVVYSTDPIPERICSDCRQPSSMCLCELARIKAIKVLKPLMKFEKKGRAGKIVTVLARLPPHQAYLKDLCAYLKRAVGSGGTYYIQNAEGVVEIQGDWRKELVELAQTYHAK